MAALALAHETSLGAAAVAGWRSADHGRLKVVSGEAGAPPLQTPQYVSSPVLAIGPMSGFRT